LNPSLVDRNNQVMGSVKIRLADEERAWPFSKTW
jgi:hypothetical protein